ncbi:MAG: hypothetical protein ACKVT1_09445 [Dehalococcoidia bacterium]
MAVHRPILFSPEEIAELLPPEDEIRHRFDERRRNECVLNKPEVTALVKGGYAAACEGRLLGYAPTWEELKEQLIRDGWYEPGVDPVGMVIGRAGTRVSFERPTLFTPEEVAAFLSEHGDRIRRGFDEGRKNECVLNKPEVAALVKGGYAAACEGRLLGYAPTWEELKEQLIRDGWYEPGVDPVGMVIRRVGNPGKSSSPAARDD